MKTIRLKNVYLNSCKTIVGKKEEESPLNEYFDYFINDYYYGEKSFEKAEIKMVKKVIDELLIESKYLINDIDLALGSDLLNQLLVSSYTMRDYNIDFIGTYAACSALGLNMLLGSLLLETKLIENCIVFGSSHHNSAERQFRYPLEYGIQKREHSTFTTTGAFAGLLSSNKSQVRVSSVTLGRVIDYGLKDSSELGSVMAIACYDTFKKHLMDLNLKPSDYDLIVSGDLANIGKKIFLELAKKDGLILDNYEDLGTLIYDINYQDVFEGGSGVAVSGVVSFSYLYKSLLNGKYRKVLIISTGALLSPIMSFQKESIPSIAHAFSLEVC